MAKSKKASAQTKQEAESVELLGITIKSDGSPEFRGIDHEDTANALQRVKAFLDTAHGDARLALASFAGHTVATGLNIASAAGDEHHDKVVLLLKDAADRLTEKEGIKPHGSIIVQLFADGTTTSTVEIPTEPVAVELGKLLGNALQPKEGIVLGTGIVLSAMIQGKIPLDFIINAITESYNNLQEKVREDAQTAANEDQPGEDHGTTGPAGEA